MCGIAGIAIADRAGVGAEVLRRMNARLVHRGPDGEGIWQAPGIGLAHRRLRIIDLSDAGRQPMGNETGDVQVTFNGEIYNFLQLRPPLEAAGHRFCSATDTEVLVHLYEELGPQMVGKLRGMFAFGLWDDRARRLLLARDRIGVKPLYYAPVPGGLAFASEIKALLEIPQIDRTLDAEAFGYFLAYGYLPREVTPYRGIRKLLPGHTLCFEPDSGRPARLERYWSLDDFTSSPSTWRSMEQCVEAVREKLVEAVQLRMISDAPLGAFLSGGTDSSIVVSAMARLASGPVSTFTIGFDDPKVDERSYARAVAEANKTSYHERVVGLDDLSMLGVLTNQFDELFADSSALPTYHVCKLARERVTVALSGDGGDEGFGGYEVYSRMQARNPFDVLPPLLRSVLLLPLERAWPNSLRGKGWLQRTRKGFIDRYLAMISVYPGQEWREALAEPLRRELADFDPYALYRDLYAHLPGPPLERLMRLDVATYLPEDILQKVDRTSMAVSLEAREPLIDHELMQLAFSIPLELKMQHGKRKALLRAAGAGLAPAMALTERKQGFTIPLQRWFRGDLQALFRARVLSSNSPAEDLIDRRAAQRLLAAHQSGNRDFGRRLWCLLMMAEWAGRFRS